MASVDFTLRYDAAQQHSVIQNLSANADSAKQGLKNGDSLFKIDNQELKKLSADQVNNLLTGSVGSTVSVQRAANQPEIMLVRNKKVKPIFRHRCFLIRSCC